MQPSLIFRNRQWLVLLLITLTVLIAGFALLPRLKSKRTTLFPYAFSTASSDEALRNLESDIAFYQERSNRSPNDGLELASLAGAYLTKARVSGWANWYLLSEQAAKRSLANLPTFNTGALLVLADIAQARHDFKESIRLAQEVLKYQPSNEGALATLVTAYLAQNNVEAAQTITDDLTTRLPTSGSLSLRALVNIAQGKDEAAQRDFEAAIGLEEPGDPYSSAWLRTQLGRLHLRHGRTVEAEALYSEALRISADHTLTQLSLADLKLKTGDYKTATELYQAVLDRAKDSSTVFDHVALQGLWRTKTLQGDSAGASEILERAETIIRTDTYSNVFGHPRELARLLLERGKAKDLPEVFTLLEVELANRRDPTTLDIAARAYTRTGDYDRAQPLIREALGQGLQEAGLYHRAGVIEENLGNKEQATVYFNRALAIDPTFNAETWRRLEQ
jgi:tetratricopeptide (TPR) repeat protein